MLEDVDWEAVTRRLTIYARRRLGKHGNLHDAKELACEAVRQVLDPKYKDWDPGAQPDLLLHLGSVVNGLISNRRRTRTEELLVDAPGGVGTDEPTDDRPTAEHKVLASEIVDRVMRRIERDKLVSDIFMLEMDDVSEPREQARWLVVPIADINNARRRLATHLNAVKTELQQEEEERDVD